MNKLKGPTGRSKGTAVAAGEIQKGLTNPLFEFVFEGKLCKSKNGSFLPVKMLRDTGARISLVAKDAINLADSCIFGKSVLIRGTNSTKKLAIVELYLSLHFGSGKYRCALRGDIQVI